MAVDFSFGQVEAVCVAMQDIAPDKRTAFTSRLKHLMKSGIIDEDRPRGEFRPGRGKAAKFSFSQLMKMVIGVELVQAGIPPALAAKLVSGNWNSLRVGVHFALYNEVEKRERGDPREETHWILSPETLRELSNIGESRFDHYEAFATVYRSDDLLAHFARHEGGMVTGHYRRQLVLNGTAIARAAAFLIANELTIASIQELQADIYAEIDADQKALDRAVEELALRGEISKDSADKLSKMIPVFRDFDKHWETKVLATIDKLTERQKEIIAGAEEGADIEIRQDDLLALRKFDLIGLCQGDLVVTDLGQEVATELRRRDGHPDPESPRLKERIERAAELVEKLSERGTEEKPAMIPVELAVLANAGFNLQEWLKNLAANAMAPRPSWDDSPVSFEQAIIEAGLDGQEGRTWRWTVGDEVATLLLPDGERLLVNGGLDGSSDHPDAEIKSRAKTLIDLRTRKTDYVIVFTDRDFMDQALVRDATLVDWAFERRVLLATPSGLREILATVATIWARAEGEIHVDSH